MSRIPSTRAWCLVLMVLVAAAVAAPGPAFGGPQGDDTAGAQAPDTTAPAQDQTQAGEPDQGAADATAPSEGEAQGDDQGLEGIDQLLQGEEAILAGEGYSYDPGNRRDPFKSLLAATEIPNFRGPRPEGIPGLLIDEVILTGIFRTEDGYVAQVQSAENEKSYLLKEGDQLYDGDVVRITGNEVVFKQIVQDPTALKPFREVVKTLSSERG